MKEKIYEIFRFGIVGLIATTIHYLVYIYLESIGITYNISYTVAYLISFIFNFLLSNYFTFKTSPDISRGIKFSMSHIFNYLLQVTLLNIFIGLRINKKIAPLIVYCISIPINFILVRISLKGLKFNQGSEGDLIEKR